MKKLFILLFYMSTLNTINCVRIPSGTSSNAVPAGSPPSCLTQASTISDLALQERAEDRKISDLERKIEVLNNEIDETRNIILSKIDNIGSMQKGKLQEFYQSVGDQLRKENELKEMQARLEVQKYKQNQRGPEVLRSLQLQ